MATVRRSAVAVIFVSFAVLCGASTVQSSSSSSSISSTTITTIPTAAPAITPALSAVSQTTQEATPTGPITTAPIFLPHYRGSAWSALRGSILASDDVKNCTTYTIFCCKEPAKGCNLALEFPFIIVEGPKTVEFHGTYTSTLYDGSRALRKSQCHKTWLTKIVSSIANIACDLDGRTAATCSGYSSYKSGYKNGHVTGPTEISWSSTLTGTDVQWGVLTMAALPKPTGDAGDSADVTVAPTENTGLLFVPSDTPGNAASTQAVQAWAAIVVAASTVFAGLLL
ncbi:hypothetical protein BBO_05505 [Beauveria brongniartii RCEF 3172]|uniref:Uncharacterized protein n=1 Tax=Beauveria brongniartii RCEF 3172 TaxID=1081107 RepID=A0A167CSE6_9HYPO|nr:hypothetical protein BBO_05505 [Beauveria brongniartii RCEF 3172]